MYSIGARLVKWAVASMAGLRRQSRPSRARKIPEVVKLPRVFIGSIPRARNGAEDRTELLDFCYCGEFDGSGHLWFGDWSTFLPCGNAFILSLREHPRSYFVAISPWTSIRMCLGKATLKMIPNDSRDIVGLKGQGQGQGPWRIMTTDLQAKELGSLTLHLICKLGRVTPTLPFLLFPDSFTAKSTKMSSKTYRSL